MTRFKIKIQYVIPSDVTDVDLPIGWKVSKDVSGKKWVNVIESEEIGSLKGLEGLEEKIKGLSSFIKVNPHST